MLVLEQKLSILALGANRPRRNPALDVLTGRVADERLQHLQAALLAREIPPASTDKPAGPSSMVLPIAAIRMAAVARTKRIAPSPWLQPMAGEARHRLRLIAPPPSRWARVPWFGGWLVWLMGESRPYKSTGRSPRARLAS
jgi:hypothetical protein